MGKSLPDIIRTSSTSTELPPPLSSRTAAACRQWILEQLTMPSRPPAQWGKGLSILLATGAVVQRSLRLGGTPGWREMSLFWRSLPPSSATPSPLLRGNATISTIFVVPPNCPARKEEDRITWMIQTMMATSTIWTMTSNSERRVFKSELHDEVHLLLDGGGCQQHQQSLPATAVVVLVVSTTYVKKGGDLPPWAGDFPPKGKNQSIWKL